MKKNSCGFSLLEALVAMVILSLSAMVYFQMVSNVFQTRKIGLLQNDLITESKLIFQELIHFNKTEEEFPFEGANESLSWATSLRRYEPGSDRQSKNTLKTSLYHMKTKFYRTANDTLLMEYDYYFLSEDKELQDLVNEEWDSVIELQINETDRLHIN